VLPRLWLCCCSRFHGRKRKKFSGDYVSNDGLLSEELHGSFRRLAQELERVKLWLQPALWQWPAHWRS
jgi:hypothetical protein